MNLLLDTCTLIWLTSDPQRLSSKVSQTIDAEETTLFLSDSSVWEIVLKWQREKIELPLPPRNWIQMQCTRWFLEAIPIERHHLFRVSELPHFHADPFDRLIVAQAIEENLVIATPDSAIARYPVPTIW